MPNEIKDYISVPETEDGESRFEISKMCASKIGTYGQTENDPNMFRNKVIKDLSSTKDNQSTNLSKFGSKAGSM